MHAQYEAAIERWTNEVVAYIEQRLGIKIDPGVWDFIKDLITQLLPLIIGCFAGAGEAVSGLKNLNRFQRARLDFAIWLRMPTRMYREFGGALYDGIIKTAGTATTEEMEATYATLKS